MMVFADFEGFVPDGEPLEHLAALRPRLCHLSDVLGINTEVFLVSHTSVS